MSKSLDDLCPACRPLFEKLIFLAEENFAWDMVLVDVLRTAEQQTLNIKNGVSWTVRSKHLPQAMCGKSHAIDVVPKHLAVLKGWGPQSPDWERLGVLGESLGLRWGGRFKPQHRDCSHFESVCSE